MAGRKKRRTKINKQGTNNQFLIVSVVVAVLITGLFIGAISARSAPAISGEKIVKFTSPAEVVKATEAQQAQPATPVIVTPVLAVSEKLPDLQTQVFSTYSGETKAAIRMTTDVMNRGDGDVMSNYKVTYGYDKKTGTNRIEYVKVGDYDVKGTHKAGQTKTFAFLWVPDTAGVYDFNICTDYENAVKESNDENNCVKSAVTVKNFAKYA